MNHPWQQPIRPLEVYPTPLELWRPVLFIRPRTNGGWEVITVAGSTWSNDDSTIREVKP